MLIVIILGFLFLFLYITLFIYSLTDTTEATHTKQCKVERRNNIQNKSYKDLQSAIILRSIQQYIRNCIYSLSCKQMSETKRNKTYKDS